MTDPDAFTVTPLGGAQEVGRSCYHVDLGDHDFLIDCGLRQSTPVSYPNFEALENGQIDAVFLTHAHIDHIGGLPILEHEGYLTDDAPIICTQPTSALASTLLWDSLNIHQTDCERDGRTPRYGEPDLEVVLDRLNTRNYGTGVFHNVQYQFGSAGHLLGSAWLALEHERRRIVFSGDLGGRSGHLRDIDTPPSADVLFLESTYGGTDTHPSFTNAQTTLWEEICAAVKRDIPVLLPTFGVGRAQELLQMFNNRIRSQQASDDVIEKIDIIYDGMITDSMQIYHAFVRNEWLDESVIKYKNGHSDDKPFLPEQAWTPSRVADRQRYMNDVTTARDTSPVIVAPSGMFTGGWSPWYLWQLTEHCDTARVFITGFQAAYTPGRQLLEAEEETVSLDITALMDPQQADHIIGEEEFGIHRKSITVPRNWVGRVNGFSAHAARQGLLHFAREVDPGSIHLIHGEAETIKTFRNHLQENTNSMVSAATKGVTVPIDWTNTKEGLTPDEPADASETVTDDSQDTGQGTAGPTDNAVQELLASNGEELAQFVAIDSDVFTNEQEARVRELIREELAQLALQNLTE
jgi:Cft2 family RNA processing exonuclease